ncbi:hypothetical protein [Ancylobacter terrae]|uniref:hypothetical protein n=1 Tax=Ancylobacter sp. sgz301288 TaxID=3342077 RepID=UPI00385E0BF4
MGAMFGGGSEKAAALAQRQAAAAQRRQLADLARQQGEVDQAKSTGGGTRGRRLLTFFDALGAQQGASTMGGGS